MPRIKNPTAYTGNYKQDDSPIAQNINSRKAVCVYF